MSHPELQAEQAYVDHAYECLERMREIVLRAGDAADGEVAQAALDAWAAKRLATFEDAERGLMFGRLDFEAVERALYVGRRWVHDDEGEQVVVNWQAPAARPFYTATPQDPQRVTLRRRFRAQGRRLVDIADEALDGSTLDGASVGDFLLEELERSRDTHMRDIVATIQADQYRLITREPVRPLVIQGGPGTGKTAVGLHRASWLIYTEREKNARSRVLVVGPNRTFMEYVSHVLPALGEGSVEQLAVAELVAGVEPTLRDAPAVARLKADTRLADVIARAAELRLAAEPEELILKLEGEYIRVRVREQQRLLEEIREQHGTTAAARERFRMGIVRSFYGEYGRILQGGAIRDGEEVEKALKANGYLNRVARARLARGHAREARALALHDACLPRRGRRRHPRRGRAAAAAPPRRGLERVGRAAARRGARARRRARPHLRPRDRRRGAGSLADAAADDRAARARRRADDPRRRRPGHRAGHVRELGRRAAAPPARRRRRGRGASPRLPRPARDHGARAAAARHDRARDRAAARVPRRRRRAADPPGRRGRAAARGLPRGGAAGGARTGSSR